MCMYICIYLCIYICIRIYTYLYICTYMYIYMYIPVLHAYIHPYMHIYTYIYLRTYMYTYPTRAHQPRDVLGPQQTRQSQIRLLNIKNIWYWLASVAIVHREIAQFQEPKMKPLPKLRCFVAPKFAMLWQMFAIIQSMCRHGYVYTPKYTLVYD